MYRSLGAQLGSPHICSIFSPEIHLKGVQASGGAKSPCASISGSPFVPVLWSWMVHGVWELTASTAPSACCVAMIPEPNSGAPLSSPSCPHWSAHGHSVPLSPITHSPARMAWDHLLTLFCAALGRHAPATPQGRFHPAR